MDLRFNRACGAMIGLTFGHAIAADTIGDPIEESTSISERILALLTADDSNGNPVETSFSGSHNRTYDLIISAIKAALRRRPVTTKHSRTLCGTTAHSPT